MLIYLSGETAAAKPEKVLGGTGNVMLAYNLIKRKNGKIGQRFQEMYNFRLKGKKRGEDSSHTTPPKS